MHIHTYIYIYIYIYIYTNLISTSIHGTRKKNKKKPGQEQEKKVSRITTQGKKKKIWGQKEKVNLVRPLEKNQGVRSQWHTNHFRLLTSNPFLNVKTVLFQPIHFSTSTQFDP